MGKHYIDPVGRPTGSCRPVIKKIARLEGRLGLGPRFVGRIGSGVRVNASFFKCPTSGSVRVRTPRRGRQGRCSIYPRPMKMVHLLLIGGLLHLVQREGYWAGLQPAQAPPRCTKCNSPPINGQCTTHRTAV